MLRPDWYPRLLRWQLRLEKALDRLLGWRKPLEMTSFTGFYKKIWQEAAGEIAASFEQIDDGVWEVRRNGLVTIINNFKVQLDDPVNSPGIKPSVTGCLRAKGCRFRITKFIG